MKITIDTKEDSPTDIRKVIALLSKMIEDSGHYSNISEDSNQGLGISETSSSESPAENAFANMFGDNLSSTQEKKEEDKEKEETPQVMEY